MGRTRSRLTAAPVVLCFMARVASPDPNVTREEFDRLNLRTMGVRH